jgi:hypothetical protein
LHHAVIVYDDAVSCSPIWGIPPMRLAGRLNLLLSQLPGKFCAPFLIEPLVSMTPADERREFKSFVFRPRDQVFEQFDEELDGNLPGRFIIGMTP